MELVGWGKWLSVPNQNPPLGVISTSGIYATSLHHHAPYSRTDSNKKKKKKHVRGDKTAMRTCPSLVNAYISCRLHILPYNQTCAPSLVDAPLIFRVHLQTFIIVIPAHSMIEKKKENKLTCVCIIVREYLLSCEPTLRARGHYNSVQVWPETRRKVQG